MQTIVKCNCVCEILTHMGLLVTEPGGVRIEIIMWL